MKTKKYNPSSIEISIADVLEKKAEAILTEMEGEMKLEKVTTHLQRDNPNVMIDFIDQDGDPHTVIIQIIQKPDIE